ncbi:hypothetical protein PROH_07045 [Prochlorothrix hollandica PCC 9006 = CALU 1027]|uniref:Uncharacterized protein n=1 Tax=Prochlorothrix hollandica PCC 9006 = CALU 1027 TaxID=317619 RepID=A0A0M2PU44_PROHO|nr:hypothetical protein PROH_07045 [Prochlorothrix hollandica PCC 9006 = CALU 1027]
MDDGLLELTVIGVMGSAVQCQVVEGGMLKSRKGVGARILVYPRLLWAWIQTAPLPMLRWSLR